MKRNKKGFTLVELVIVIAVIAILAAVLLPTFSNVIESAKVSSASQNAANAFKAYYATDSTANVADEYDTMANYKNFVFIVLNGNNGASYYFTVGESGALSAAQKDITTLMSGYNFGSYDNLADVAKLTAYTGTPVTCGKEGKLTDYGYSNVVVLKPAANSAYKAA